jgi:hypothetical protein
MVPVRFEAGLTTVFTLETISRELSFTTLPPPTVNLSSSWHTGLNVDFGIVVNKDPLI